MSTDNLSGNKADTRQLMMPLRSRKHCKALRKGGNILAVHTHQTVGGQFIDFALLCEPQ